jgi:hypothetical protein
MRPCAALFLATILPGSLLPAPPAQNGDTGPRSALSPAQTQTLKNETPLTDRGVARLVGPPARVHRHPNHPGKAIWEYRVATGGFIYLDFNRGRLVDAMFPKD